MKIIKNMQNINLKNNFIPCNLDICSCMYTYNLKKSYTHRYIYYKCYERNKIFNMKFIKKKN